MALIISPEGIVKCAAKHQKGPRDIYVGDALHYNLAMFFLFYDDEMGTSEHQIEQEDFKICPCLLKDELDL